MNESRRKALDQYIIDKQKALREAQERFRACLRRIDDYEHRDWGCWYEKSGGESKLHAVESEVDNLKLYVEELQRLVITDNL